MKKSLIITLVIVIIGMVGFGYYLVNSPFTVNGVKIPENINSYTLSNVEPMNGYLVTGKLNEESFIDTCKYATYNPESSLNNIYICKPKNSPDNSLNSWIASQTGSLNQGGQKFSTSETEIGSIIVKTVTISDENCGNPGFCTTYYWLYCKNSDLPIIPKSSCSGRPPGIS